jgi:hypothetical protein
LPDEIGVSLERLSGFGRPFDYFITRSLDRLMEWLAGLRGLEISLIISLIC